MSDEHLPVFGVGPIYVISIMAVTVAALLLDHFDLVPDIRLGYDTVFKVIGVVLILMWIPLWYGAAVRTRVGDGVRENRLVTDGVYAWVRNPIYSAFMFLCWGLLVYTGNLCLFVFIPLFWVLLTVMMQNTEEKWLSGLYGREYADYCSRVNRCIPWFPKKP